MREYNVRNIIILTILVCYLPLLYAEDKRAIPLDMYLIMDNSSFFQDAKTDAVAWFGTQVVDRVFAEGDKVTIWAAGNSAEIVYSDEISNTDSKIAIKDKLTSLPTDNKTADFSDALKDLQTRLSGASPGRLPYTMLVTASAGSLGNALTGSTQTMLKWFRTEKYERWQAFILGPDIGGKVSQAAQNYMNSQK